MLFTFKDVPLRRRKEEFQKTKYLDYKSSRTGNLIFGLLISGISSCLTSLNFWITNQSKSGCEHEAEIHNPMRRFLGTGG